MIEKDYIKLAKLMLYAPILDWTLPGDKPLYGTLNDLIEMLDYEDAVQLGVVMLENKYHGISDIRADEIEDGKVFVLAKALKYAMERNKI